jgi:Flp pilus assembly protein TadD
MKNATLLAAAGCAWAIWMLAGCSESKKEPAQLKLTPAPEVADDFDKAADRPPTPRTLYAMAKLLQSQGKDSEAQYVLARLVSDHPKFLPAYVELASLQMRNGAPAVAEQTINQGLKVEPNDPVLRNNLGMLLALRHEYEAALDQFIYAASLAPENSRYLANKAMAMGMLGRYDEALELYSSILGPQQAHHNVAVLCEARKDAERAQIERAAAQALLPTTAPAAAPAKRPTSGPASS